jgi:hypothetical protein
MHIDSVQARIEHETAELRACFAHITDCRSLLIRWDVAGEKRYSLRLDIRWPQHQTLMSSEPYDSAPAAIEAAFHAARELMRQANGHAARVTQLPIAR